MFFYRPGDPDQLLRFVEGVQEGERINVTAYDKALLTLSTAALALSLAFVKDLVPVQSAQYFSALVASWIGFVVSISLSIFGYIRVVWIATPRIDLAARLFRGGAVDANAASGQLEAVVRRDESWIRWLNIIQGLVFLLSMALLTFYVCYNLAYGPPDPWAAWRAGWAAVR